MAGGRVPGSLGYGDGGKVVNTPVPLGTSSNDMQVSYERETWLHAWLLQNAVQYRFYPLASEEWHWDYR